MEQQGVEEELLQPHHHHNHKVGAQYVATVVDHCQFVSATLPQAPFPTKTQIITLQHPYEFHHKLNTAHLLPKCLLNTTILLGHRFHPNKLDPLIHNHQSSICYLFPSTISSPTTTLSKLPKNNPLSLPNIYTNDTQLVLIVFDATWQHAKEMVSASEGFLESLGAKKLCLDGGADERADGRSIYDSESGLLLRKEPFGGCVSTLEVVARYLRVVEGEPKGIIVERTLNEVLREMVRLQRMFLKPLMKPRQRIMKKGKHKHKEEERI